MITLVVGDDKYRIEKKLEKLRTDLGGDADLNFLIIENNFEFERLKNEAETLPFLGNKKVIIIKYIFETKNKDLFGKLENWLQSLKPQNDLIFIEKEIKPPVKKIFEKCGKIENYQPLNPTEITNWILTEVKKQSGKISTKDANLLGTRIGSDLIALENEIKKLIAYNAEISENSIKHLTTEGYFDSIFTLMDAISEKNKKKSLDLLSRFVENDENYIYLLSMLSRQIRNLILVKYLYEERKSESQIVSETKLHPYVVKKTLTQSKNFALNKLLKMHRDLLNTDLTLKSTNSDPKLIFDRLIISFTN